MLMDFLLCRFGWWRRRNWSRNSWRGWYPSELVQRWRWRDLRRNGRPSFGRGDGGPLFWQRGRNGGPPLQMCKGWRRRWRNESLGGWWNICFLSFIRRFIAVFLLFFDMQIRHPTTKLTFVPLIYWCILAALVLDFLFIVVLFSFLTLVLFIYLFFSRRIVPRSLESSV